MTDETAQCSCVVDTDGLHSIAVASGNLKAILLDRLRTGIIAVPAAAWREFEKAYEEEAATLKPFITRRIIMKRAYYIGAARIADKLDSGFPRGPYDDNVELITASVASANGYDILTSTAQLTVYEEMGCEACDLETWIAK
jgi:hypothetical protein